MFYKGGHPLFRNLTVLLCAAAFILSACGRESFVESSALDPQPPAEVSFSEGSSSLPPESSSVSEPQPETAPPDWRLVLVNFEHPIPDDWSVDLTMTRYGYEVDSRITEDVDALISAAANDGVSLIICYGYRTLEQSQQLFDKQLKKQLSYGLSQEAAYLEAKRWVAPPGTSDHHTGLALDIVTPSHQVLNHDFANTDAGIWLKANSWKYGFVVRFPADKQDITGITYEPWHVRFVGKEHAASMYEHNKCLEEYVTRLYDPIED